ncbi:hypothetical protein E4K67_20840 [Desulfosporosinus fructosivorans]|uniref:Uncharacterized protein n=1 Tax=Desulfosporosinus fructosivorans TaxID=2018669 RepID=A0A4Z0R1X5_9FIRM|nr:hypothetical protein [Desulfosporosinus fructosivorans]TGE36375.1 hypothetical protein E4K67_20840 [Desulfosporosinus fructosivorans]
MKFKKKTAMLVSFTLGTLLVASTALADIANKSGYDQLKDALKVTAEQSSEKFDSFTLDFSMAMKDNGKTLMTSNEVAKHDRSKGASETISSGESLNGNKNNSNYYSDKKTMIRVSESDPTYYVTEFTKERTEDPFDNPFKEDGADDIEKIADAIVGSLKDHVVVTENSDGSLGFAGSLTEVQIPSLVNAVASYSLKQEFNGNQDNMPHLTKDVFVKEVKGTAKVNKDGVMENILGTAVLSGKDKQGTVHEVTIEVLAKLSGINSTTVTKPDLTGKKVIKNIAKNENSGPEISNPEKFVGKFSNDILLEKDNKFVKAGERIIEITQIDNKTVVGRYYEEYKPGFEEYATTQRNFEIDAKMSDKENSSGYDYTTKSGSKGDLFIDEHSAKIYVNGITQSMSGLIFNSEFSPDVE